jgi:hypothetical protein
MWQSAISGVGATVVVAEIIKGQARVGTILVSKLSKAATPLLLG